MAKGSPAENTSEKAAPQVQMRVLRQFIRDMSFENVMAQKGLTGEIQPEIAVQVNLDAKKLQTEHQYEVAIKLNLTSKAKGMEDVLFMCELDYCGLFQIEGVADDQLHPFLMIECPRMLFPFLRRIVSDITRDGGFPAINLDNIDFVSLYRNEVLRRQAKPQKTDA